ncbi:N-6 DNA methylase [Variovorax sp. J22P168]|uniref:N-6 DNA methylase n=1 Tax=Variovorax jilinensis TaxID=3053513 RepID=UPI0025788BD4|nr:N-6 DNA methylase [Variovorax sp. J22P168]MDM0015847.1 N-6 DNA methylase [Variovorax sp. J22P168]
MAACHPIGPESHKRELTKLIRANAHRHRLHQVVSDFCELGALAISNAVDVAQRAVREERYLQIVGRYAREEVDRFPRMLATLVDWLACGFADCLGELFMSLELADHWKGQFFTPYSIASLMARVTLNDVKEKVQREGFVSICEPACGAGGMVIACADAIMSEGVNYQQAMHATAIDIDATAAHMAYLQLSLLHVPAIVVHGNSLTLEERAHWVTPAHVLGGWDWRLHRRAADGDAARAHAVPILAADVPTTNPQHARPDQVRAEVVAHRLDQLDLFAA